MSSRVFPKRILLANLPTPIQKITFENKSFYIKRDDFTGTETSGNKIRKLEYLLYQAKKEKAEYVFTCGGEQSNHARATAFAAASLGMKTRLFLWGNEKSKNEGNLFLDKILGCEIEYLSKKEFDNANMVMLKAQKKFERKGKRVYIIPEGGSSALGIWGYIQAFAEMKQQQIFQHCNSILTASGSGGTSAGLLIGAQLYGLDITIKAVNVLYSEKVIRDKIVTLAHDAINRFKIPIALNEELLQIVDGYSEEGYKSISDDKIKLIKKLAIETGIVLDPTYTGKAFAAFYDQSLKSKKSKTLFIHTGGLFGIFSQKRKYLLN